jgi:hypothetical protein
MKFLIYAVVEYDSLEDAWDDAGNLMDWGGPPPPEAVKKEGWKIAELPEPMEKI